MPRGIGATNIAASEASHVYETVLVKFEFDAPVYVHTGIGTVPFDSNDYLGVGDLGAIAPVRETEKLGPSPITLELSGINTDLIGEALDAGNFRDTVTLYAGHRLDDGSLADTPWILWRGWFEYAAIKIGADNVISVTAQHDLAELSKKDGGRLSDEDQQARYAGDIGLEYVADMATTKLVWGGGAAVPSSSGRSDFARDRVRTFQR